MLALYGTEINTIDVPAACRLQPDIASHIWKCDEGYTGIHERRSLTFFGGDGKEGGLCHKEETKKLISKGGDYWKGCSRHMLYLKQMKMVASGTERRVLKIRLEKWSKIKFRERRKGKDFLLVNWGLFNQERNTFSWPDLFSISTPRCKEPWEIHNLRFPLCKVMKDKGEGNCACILSR